MNQNKSQSTHMDKVNADYAYSYMQRIGVDKTKLHRKPYHMTYEEKKKGVKNEEK